MKKIQWMIYDFGNSAYALIVMTLFYPIYFTEFLFPSSDATSIWGASVASSIFFIGILSPVIGMVLDRSGKRVLGFRILALCAIIGTFLLSIAVSNPYLAAGIFVVTNIFFGLSLFSYDALVIDAVEDVKEATTLSGAGWALGYVGGPLCLGIALIYLGKMAPISEEEFRFVFAMTSLFFLIFAMPMLLGKISVLSEKTDDSIVPNPIALIRNWKEHRKVFSFLIAIYFVSDALITIVYFVSIYAKNSLNLSLEDIVFFMFYVQAVAIPATYLISRWANQNREIKALTFCTAVWAIIVVALYFVTTNLHFYIVGAATGLVVGTTPALARGYLAKIIPMELRSEFFGFNVTMGRLASLIGPIIFTIAASAYNMKVALLTVLPFLLIGLILLMRLEETD